MSPAGVPLEELRFRLRGELYGPGDPGYHEACALLGAQAGGQPRLVARCSAPEDVVAALAFARREGLAVAVRGGGHALPRSCEGALLIDLGGICDVEVDRERRLARVGGGASAAAIERATRTHGLTTTLWREGESCDDLRAAQLVSFEGEILRASAEENPALLRALQAGDAGAGIVTTLELRLRPLAA
ncbi:MAG TPA: FAD-binding protein [Solirubrobacterales bacterium]|nr:FAD-binding protein [Solirubrobacterales bacterium]